MIEHIAKSYQRPTFIYQQTLIDGNIDQLHACLKQRAHLLYSIKANPNPHVIQAMVNKGLGLECSSSYELHLAIQSGCDPNGIVCIGPGKSEALIKACVRHRIGAIYCESMDELDLIQAACNTYDRSMAVVLRVHIVNTQGGGHVSMTSRFNPFGLDQASIHLINDHHLRWDRCQIVGLHYYQGSRQSKPATVQAHIECAQQDFTRWQLCWHRPLDILGLGLGLSSADDPEMNTMITQCLEKLQACQISIELGRSLVGNAGQLLCRVVSTKNLDDTHWAMLDTGYHHIMDTCFRTTFFRSYPKIQPLIIKDGPSRRYRIAGPLCTPSDRLHDSFDCNILQRGDFLLIQNVGAYAWNHSPTFFLGHSPADQLFLTATRTYRADPYTDFINHHKDAHEDSTSRM